MAGTVRIELTSAVLETVILPLNYIPNKMAARHGFEPWECQSQSLMPYRLATGQCCEATFLTRAFLQKWNWMPYNI